MRCRKSVVTLLLIAISMALMVVPAKAKESNVIIVNSSNSAQNLNYIVYVPDNVSAATPVFLFLHGDSESNADIYKITQHFTFMRLLLDGSWKPDFIFVMPINKKKGNWLKVTKSVNTILDEVTRNYGGSLDNMYIGGSSAGSDAVIFYQAAGRFKGGICMAGNIGDEDHLITPEQIMSLWSDRKLFYYRDNLDYRGGYGWDPVYFYDAALSSITYNVKFTIINTDWAHDYKLVDRVFLPEYMTDSKGQNCYDAINHLIYG